MAVKHNILTRGSRISLATIVGAVALGGFLAPQ